MNRFDAYILTAVGLAFFALIFLGYRNHQKRLAFINHFSWPPGLINRLHSYHPHLSAADTRKVSDGLKQFFRAYLNGRKRPVAMPSQVVDDLWHEFILYTRDYAKFCGTAFGTFLHHTPSIALGRDKKSNEGLRRVWWQTCKEEGINPKAAATLPLLFTLDAALNIPNGYRYHPNCEDLRQGGDQTTQCGGDFSSSGYDGGTVGLGDGDGGDGGGGCGGD